MDFSKFSKLSPSAIGLLQAIGVALYCFLIGGFIWIMEKSTIEPAGILGPAFVLLLLVFSAAVAGSLVFGYPAFLAINNKIKKALFVLGYTFLYSLLIIIITTVTIFLIY